jgi:hypothetical protein
MADDDDDVRFTQSCTNTAEYPKNIVRHSSYDYLLTAYTEQLDAQESRLFCHESKAAVYIQHYDEAKKGVQDYLASQQVLKAVQLKPNTLIHSIRISLCEVIA